MVDATRRAGGYLPFEPTTEYVNTIPPQPGGEERPAMRRWNGASAR